VHYSELGYYKNIKENLNWQNYTYWIIPIEPMTCKPIAAALIAPMAAYIYEALKQA
jgi:hypothetical protein